MMNSTVGKDIISQSAYDRQSSQKETESESQQPKPTYLQSAAEYTKSGTILTFGTIAGCYATFAIAPPLAGVIVGTATTTILSNTINASIGVLSFAAARYVATKGTEKSLEVSTQAVQKGLTYAYERTFKSSTPDVEESVESEESITSTYLPLVPKNLST